MHRASSKRPILTRSFAGAFIVCDLPYQYIGEYIGKLGEGEFPPIHNAELLTVDTYPYGVDWKISAKDAQRQIGSYRRPASPPPSPSGSENSGNEASSPKLLTVIDLREPPAAPSLRVPNLQYFPVCSSKAPNPFKDPATLAQQWRDLNAGLGVSDGPFGRSLETRQVILFCHTGNTASIAASVLRSRGVEAYWVDGGVDAFAEMGAR